MGMTCDDVLKHQHEMSYNPETSYNQGLTREDISEQQHVLSSNKANQKRKRRRISMFTDVPPGQTGAPSRNRTYNLRIRSPLLYPLSHGRNERA